MQKLFFILLLIFSPLLLAQTAFRWVDKDGKVHYSDQPPEDEGITVQQKRIGKNFIETSRPSFAMQQAMKNFPIVIYTGNGCDQPCKSGRDLLNRRRIPFEERIVATEKDVTELQKLAGGKEVPVLKVGKQVQKGFEESLWNGLLDAAGYPHTVVTTTQPTPSNRPSNTAKPPSFPPPPHPSGEPSGPTPPGFSPSTAPGEPGANPPLIPIVPPI